MDTTGLNATVVGRCLSGTKQQTDGTRVLNKVPSVFLLNLRSSTVKIPTCFVRQPCVTALLWCVASGGVGQEGPSAWRAPADIVQQWCHHFPLGGGREGGGSMERRENTQISKTVWQRTKKRAGQRSLVWVPNQSRHSWLNCVSSSSFFSFTRPQNKLMSRAAQSQLN